jgi:predicted enzyme related to lactoylglutathione lyase
VVAPVVHFEINGRDFTLLTEFYAKVFGWEMHEAMPGGYALAHAKVGDKGIDGGIGGSTAESQAPGVTFYVEVPDPQATLDEIVAAGGTVVTPLTKMEMVTFALFADPEGHVVGIVKDE